MCNSAVVARLFLLQSLCVIVTSRLSEQGWAGHRPEGHLLQDTMRADANAVSGLQPAGGQGQPGLLGPSGCGASVLDDLHLWTVQGEQETLNSSVPLK